MNYKQKNKYFCNCGNPIEEDEVICIDCMIYSGNKHIYLSEEMDT